MSVLTTGPVSVYEIKTVFHAPLEYAYAWCTDYTDADRKLQGDPGSRQLIRKNQRTVVYEDLNETPHGWMWRVLPPTRRISSIIARANGIVWSQDSMTAFSPGRTLRYLVTMFRAASRWRVEGDPLMGTSFRLSRRW